MGYSVYFWGEVVIPTGKISAWKKHVPDIAQWNDWAGDFESEEPPDFRWDRVVSQLRADLGAVKRSGFCSVSFYADRARILGVFGEDTFRSHAKEIATIFRSTASFGGEGELSFLTDENDAFVLHVSGGKSWFEKTQRQMLDLDGYEQICAAVNQGKEKPVEKIPTKVKTPDVLLAKHWVLIKTDPVQAFRKYGRIPGKDASENKVKFFNIILSDVGSVAEWAFDGLIDKKGVKDILAIEPRWYDLCIEAFKDKRFHEEALGVIKYHPEKGVPFIVENFSKLGEDGLNALYDCFINGPKGRLPLSLLDPLKPLAKKDKELAYFLEKVLRRAGEGKQ